MKKMLLVVMVLIGILSLGGCKNKDKDTINTTDKDYYVYSIEENINNFFVDEKGVVYYPVENEREEKVVAESGSTYTNFIQETLLYSMNVKGETIETEVLPIPYIGEFYIAEDILYYSHVLTDENSNPIIKLYSYHRKDKTIEERVTLKDTERMKRFTVVDNILYFLAEDRMLRDKTYSLAGPWDMFYYMGEYMGALDLSTGELIRLDVEFPISFSPNKDGKITIYAYDEEKGFYFIDYEGKEKILSNQNYRNLGNLLNFVCGKGENTILFNYVSSSAPVLSIGSTDKNEITELIPEVGIQSIYLVGDYIYYSNGMKNNQIERVKYEDYVNGSNTIRTISVLSSAYAPYGAGYIINPEYPDKDSFVISVLSQDTSFDLCILSSREDFSENIKNKGLFYPLNDIDGVNEYLDSLFPYIKDATMTDNGDIWMIPFQIDIPYIIYNDENCIKNGLDFSQELKIDDFLSVVDEVRRTDGLKGLFSYSDYILAENMLYQYFRDYSIFEGENFQRLADLIKEKANYLSDESMIMNFKVEDGLYRDAKTTYLFATEYGGVRLWDDGKYPSSLKASKMPSATENTKSVATSVFLCVNPASKNLKETLNYISALCKELIQRDSSRILQQNQTFHSPFFQELHKVYADSEIIFTMPQELWHDDFGDYLKGDMDFETMIKEMNRKIEMYRGE